MVLLLHCLAILGQFFKPRSAVCTMRVPSLSCKLPLCPLYTFAPLQETLNQFVFNFGSRPAQLSRIISFDLLGIPQDYLFRWGHRRYCIILQLTEVLVHLWQSEYWQPLPVQHQPSLTQALTHTLCRRYKSGIEQVQPEDVLAAAQRRLHPEQQTIVVAGDSKKLRKELEKLGMPIVELKLPK